jgi:hypothetical protein
MSLSILERHLNIKNYTLLVRDFRDAKKSPVVSEIRVFDREGNELKDLHTVVQAKDRVETIKKLGAAARAHLKASKAASKAKK